MIAARTAGTKAFADVEASSRPRPAVEAIVVVNVLFITSSSRIALRNVERASPMQRSGGLARVGAASIGGSTPQGREATGVRTSLAVIGSPEVSLFRAATNEIAP